MQNILCDTASFLEMQSCIETFISNEMEIDVRSFCTMLVTHTNKTVLQQNFGPHLEDKAKKVLKDLNLPVDSSFERWFIRHIAAWALFQTTSSVNSYLCLNINSCSDEVREKISLYNNVRQLCSALKVNNLSIHENINYRESFLHTDLTNRGRLVCISNESYAFAHSLGKLLEKDLYKSNLIFKGQH